jgi:hypothetical protein
MVLIARAFASILEADATGCATASLLLVMAVVVAGCRLFPCIRRQYAHERQGGQPAQEPAPGLGNTEALRHAVKCGGVH